jgi:predicted transposase/invertase (TIGR01784 family)
MERPILSPKSDYIFKLIFGDERNLDILQNFLQAVLDLPASEYKHIAIVDPHLKREAEDDKLGILDVKIHTTSGSVIDVEIQVESVPNIRGRLVLYGSKMVAEQISKGDEYDTIKRVISIVITDYVLLPEEAAYHNVYRLLNTQSLRPFTDLLEFNTLELPKLPAEDERSDLWTWMRFLSCKQREEFEMVAEKNPQVKKAVSVLMDLSADERTRLLEESHEKYRRDVVSRMRGAWKEGNIEGNIEGSFNRAIENAQRMKADNMPANQIVKYTGLSLEDVARL